MQENNNTNIYSTARQAPFSPEMKHAIHSSFRNRHILYAASGEITSPNRPISKKLGLKTIMLISFRSTTGTPRQSVGFPGAREITYSVTISQLVCNVAVL